MSDELCVTVHAQWDDEAKVYHAWSDDVLGLATEAESLEKLKEKLRLMVPDLIALNDHSPFEDHKNIPLCLLTQDKFSAQRTA